MAVPRELPTDVYGFTGRAGELAALDALAPAAGPGMALVVVSGTAGVGKTALAVHWAHRVADRFPDGQLYVDLRGYDPGRPVDAADALAGFLRAFGVDDVPARPDERAARFRTLTAGRRLLVVLDNAYAVEQVRPLLPGTATCATVVTSRDDLAGLVARDGARRVDLDLLPAADAVALLRLLVGDRVDADPAGAAALADRCARLPLALRIAAELAVARPATPLATLAAELAGERLDGFDAGADERSAVRAVFSWSYRHLPAPAAATFRLVGLHPGRRVDAYSVGAMAGTGPDEAARWLDVLARAHLVQPAGSGYGTHDLLRAYAVERAADDPDEARRPVLSALVGYYLGTAATAVDLAFPAERHRRPRPARTPAPAPDLPDAGAARRWLDAERANLVAVTAHAADHGLPTQAGYLALTLARYLYTGSHYTEAVAIHGAALGAARAHGDRYTEGAALYQLGRVYWRWGRFTDALEHYERALPICRETGDLFGVADALNSIGNVYNVWGRHAETLELYRQALDIRREMDDPGGEGRALANLGTVYSRAGRHAEALDHFEQALAIFRKDDDRVAEGRTLGNLGHLHARTGRLDTALDHHRLALTLLRAAHDRAAEAGALDDLGTVYGLLGRHDDAIAHHERALAIHRDLNFRTGTGETLNALGHAYRRAGRPVEAIGQHRQGLAIAREIGNRYLEASALNGLGAALRLAGRPGEARADHDAALALARRIGDREQEARALDGTAHAHAATGRRDLAEPLWRAALAIYTDLGAPEAAEVRARLTARPAP
jgi:tetratricopeptide (TPR) repeat protein